MHRSSQGEFVDKGRDDVLQRALQKKEGGGRVRAVGAGVTPTSYYGKLPSREVCLDKMAEMDARVKSLEREMIELKTSKPKKKKRHCDEEEIVEDRSPNEVSLELESLKSKEKKRHREEEIVAERSPDEVALNLKTSKSKENKRLREKEIVVDGRPDEVALKFKVSKSKENRTHCEDEIIEDRCPNEVVPESSKCTRIPEVTTSRFCHLSSTLNMNVLLWQTSFSALFFSCTPANFWNSL